MKNIAMIFILTAGILWGCLGIFVRTLNAAGLYSMQIVGLRSVVTAALLFFILFFFKKEYLKIKRKDIWCFLGTGICSIVFFNFCYFKAMQLISLSTAAILLYTAPVFVMILSRILFGEGMDHRKIIAVIMTFVGCALASGGFGGVEALSIQGILFGIGSGVGYALYSIFSRYALNKGYDTMTITFYTFLIAALGTFPVADWGNTVRIIAGSPSVLIWIVMLGALGTVVPYLTYTYGLTFVENGKAAIIACIEPVTASVVGALVFKEQLGTANYIGMILVIGALVLCNLKRKGE